MDFYGKTGLFSLFLKKLKKVLAFLKRLVYTKQVGCEQNRRRAVRPVGQGVKTSPSHGENTGSIPVLAA